MKTFNLAPFISIFIMAISNLSLCVRFAQYFKWAPLGVEKSGFKKAVIGLSGGIDSAVVAVLACHALGNENVVGIAMPSRYSTQHSIEDANQLAKNLGIKFFIESIDEIFQEYLKKTNMFYEPFDTTEENIQARIRGNLLMAWANKNNSIVLSTGNKTEIALGYCTLYGDMAGGLSPISDLNKIEVYDIAQFINKFCQSEVIPNSTITKLPSAELTNHQVDPFDYEIVAPLVDLLITTYHSDHELTAMGYDLSLIRQLKKQIQLVEYKRKQAAPGIRISPKTFGIGRNMPIVNHFIMIEKGE